MDEYEDDELHITLQRARARLVFDELINGIDVVARRAAHKSSMTPVEWFIYETSQNDRAKAVIEGMLDGDSTDDPSSHEYIAKMNRLIADNLDVDSIWAFTFMASSVLREATLGEVRANEINLEARGYAMKRHAGNHADKAKVFVWCDENMSRFKSMDDAAFDIAGTFVDQKFRAIREWMTEWKKLRSASTP